MTYYAIRMDSDSEAPGVFSIQSNVDPQTYGAIMDFLMGRVRLQVVPLDGAPSDAPADRPDPVGESDGNAE